VEEDADEVGPEDGADIGSMLGSWRDEVWLWCEKHHLVEDSKEKSEERATMFLSMDEKHGRCATNSM